jgi:hypothetical protein
MAVMTVHMPITEPTTGPAIQVGFKAAGAADCVGFGEEEVAVCFANSAEAEARDADSGGG